MSECPQCGAQLDLKLTLKSAPEATVGGVLDSKPSPKRNRYNYTNPQFTAFWSVYPRKVSKAGAYRKWLSIAPHVGPQTLIDGAANFAAVCRSNRVEQRFIPYPDKWLNDGRWDDEDYVPPAVGEIEVFDKEAHLRELEAI